MWRLFPLHISFALLLTLSLFISCQEEPTIPPSTQTSSTEAIVFETDSTEWRVCIFAEHLIYSKAVEVQLPSPWLLPTREDAAILKTISYSDGSERFVTSDGYTFGMPSASVSKAGAKTKYSVLGLHIRQTVIDVPF